MKALNEDRLNSSIIMITANEKSIQIEGYAFIKGISFENKQKCQQFLYLKDVNTNRKIPLKVINIKQSVLEEGFYDNCNYEYSSFIARVKIEEIPEGNYTINVKIIGDNQYIDEEIKYTKIENLKNFTFEKKVKTKKYMFKLLNNSTAGTKIQPAIIITSTKDKSELYENHYQITNDLIICERDGEFQDNGRALFENFLHCNNEKIRFKMVVKNKDTFPTELKPFLIEYLSAEHKKCYLTSKLSLTTHPGYENPFKIYKENHTYDITEGLGHKIKTIFIQHGVIFRNSSFLKKSYGYYLNKDRIDYIVSSTNKETKLLKSKFG